MSADAGDRFDGGGQGTMLSLKRANSLLAFFAVDIKDPNTGDFAGGDADVVIVGAPPAADDVWIGGGLFGQPSMSGSLVRGQSGKTRIPLAASASAAVLSGLMRCLPGRARRRSVRRARR
jgi:hypothetical protein